MSGLRLSDLNKETTYLLTYLRLLRYSVACIHRTWSDSSAMYCLSNQTRSERSAVFTKRQQMHGTDSQTSDAVSPRE